MSDWRKHTQTKAMFQPQEVYLESAALLKKPLAEHEGYMRENNGDWIIASNDLRLAIVQFRGKAKRGQAWNAPDPEGQANAAYLTLAWNHFEQVVEALRDLLERECPNKQYVKGHPGADKAHAVLAAIDRETPKG